MPSPVDKYVKQVREQNPDYDEAKVWATAWSIYCKYKNPGSDSCHQPASDYLKGKNAMSDKEVREFSSPEASEFQDALVVRNVVARTVAARRGKFVDLDALDTAVAGIKQGMEAWDTREDDNTERAIKKWAKDYNKLVEKAQKALARTLKENSKEWHTSADLLNAIDVIDVDKILRLTADEVSKKLDKAMTAWKEIDQFLGGQKVLFAHEVEP